MKKELRPCITRDGRRVLFHTWEQYSEVLPPSPLKGGHNGGVLAGVVAICETPTGEIVRINPANIKFLDSRHNEYAWE